jgi:ketosteroid isomerase-like protein
MKHIVSFFALLFVTVQVSFAQSDFQKEFEASRQRFIDNPYKWFQTDCTPDFQYITSNGVIVSLEQLTKQFVAKKVLRRDFTDLTFRSLGNVMIVTGSLAHKYLQQTDSSIIDYGKEAVTHTYMSDNGRWKLASAHHSVGIPAFTEATFKDLTGRYEQDPIAFFANDCTKNFASVGANGESVGIEQMKAMFKNFRCEKEEFDKLQIRQYGNLGVATGHLTAYFKKTDGGTFNQKNAFTHYYTFQNGSWKMAGFQHTALGGR